MAQNQLGPDPHVDTHVEEEFQKFKEERDELSRTIKAQNENRQQILPELQELKIQQNLPEKQRNCDNDVAQVERQIQVPAQMQTWPTENATQPNFFYQSSWKQWIAASAAAIGTGSFSPFLPCNLGLDLRYGNSSTWTYNPMLPNFHETALVLIPVVLGSIVGAILADNFGRKVTLLLALLFVIPRSTCRIYFQDSPWFWIIKIFCNFDLGIKYTVVPLYISEIADASNCANLLTIQLLNIANVNFYAIKTLIFCSLRSSFYDRTCFFLSDGIFLAVTLLFHGTTIAVFPETPQYLNSKKKYQQTAKSISSYTGRENLKIQPPLIELPTNSYSTNNQQGCFATMRDIMKPENLRCIAMIFFLIAIKWLGGHRRNHHMLNTWVNDYNNKSGGPIIGAFALRIGFAISVVIFIKILVRKTSILIVIFISFVIAIIGTMPLGEDHRVEFVVLFWENLVSYIFMGVTFAKMGQLFPAINVRAAAIATVIIFEMLCGSSMIWLEYFISVVFGVDISREWSAFNIAIYFYSFTIVFIFFPKDNKLPNTEIDVKTSTSVNSTQPDH